jgi:hypothetical protein
MSITISSSKDEVVFSEPEEFTAKNVMFYCHHTKELKQTQVHKAQQFIEADCIRYVGDDGEFKDKYSFIVLPLNTKEQINYEGRTFDKKPFKTDYNHNVYTIAKSLEYKDTFICNCQFSQKQLKEGKIREGGANCSHVLSLYFAFRMKQFGKGEKK